MSKNRTSVLAQVFRFPFSPFTSNIVWPFSKKTTIEASGILTGAADHHSHILPGVDDGVETMDEALRILATYEALGIKKLWLTPHIMEDIPNTPQKLRARFEELKANYKGNITLHLAAEYMIDNHLRKLLQNNGPSCVRGASNAVAEGDKATEPQGEISLNSPSFERREYPKGEGVEKDCSCHSDHTLTNKSKEVLGAVQSKPFQETPPLSRGEVVEDRRGEKKTTEYLMWQEQSEVTEGNQTNNCPSYIVRGASDAVAEGVAPNSLLPIGNAGKHILVETSYFNPPMRLRETLRQIKSLGYYPLLAHPERYMYMDNDEYRSLREEGVKFQLNLVSLAGGYGAAVKKKAMWLLTNGLYSVAGSDLHSEDAIEYITKCRLGKQETEQVERLLHNSI